MWKINFILLWFVIHLLKFKIAIPFFYLNARYHTCNAYSPKHRSLFHGACHLARGLRSSIRSTSNIYHGRVLSYCNISPHISFHRPICMSLDHASNYSSILLCSTSRQTIEMFHALPSYRKPNFLHNN